MLGLAYNALGLSSKPSHGIPWISQPAPATPLPRLESVIASRDSAAAAGADSASPEVSPSRAAHPRPGRRAAPGATPAGGEPEASAASSTPNPGPIQIPDSAVPLSIELS